MSDSRRMSESEPEFEDERNEALQEFVMEKLSSFEKEIKRVDSFSQTTRDMLISLKKDLNQSISVDETKLNDIENRVEANTSRIKSLTDSLTKDNEQEVEEINFQPIAESSPRLASSPEPPRKLVKFGKVQKPVFNIPEYVGDVEDEELRLKLKEMEGKVNYAKEKEKLTYCQLLYMHHWIEESRTNITGRSEQVLRLIRDGEERKMWPKNYKPNNIKADFFTYMQEKLKNLAKRRRINSQKEKLTDVYYMVAE